MILRRGLCNLVRLVRKIVGGAKQREDAKQVPPVAAPPGWILRQATARRNAFCAQPSEPPSKIKICPGPPEADFFVKGPVVAGHGRFQLFGSARTRRRTENAETPACHWWLFVTLQRDCTEVSRILKKAVDMYVSIRRARFQEVLLLFWLSFFSAAAAGRSPRSIPPRSRRPWPNTSSRRTWPWPSNRSRRVPQGGRTASQLVLPHRWREGRSRWSLDFVKDFTIFEISSTVTGKTATLTASLFHAELQGPSVTLEFSFQQNPDGNWKVVGHED